MAAALGEGTSIVTGAGEGVNDQPTRRAGDVSPPRKPDTVGRDHRRKEHSPHGFALGGLTSPARRAGRSPSWLESADTTLLSCATLLTMRASVRRPPRRSFPMMRFVLPLLGFVVATPAF